VAASAARAGEPTPPFRGVTPRIWPQRSTIEAGFRFAETPVMSTEARRRFELWAHRYDQRYGSEHSPLTYTLRAQLPIELVVDLVVIDVDVMQHEFFGASGWQRALFLDRDGNPSDLYTCDLQLDPEGWTLHRYGNGDLLRVTAAGIVSNAFGQMMLTPTLKRFDRRGRKLWTSRPVAGALPNRARDERLFDLDQFGDDDLVIETDREIAVINANTGRRSRARSASGLRRAS
jgi:hypothetical protein